MPRENKKRGRRGEEKKRKLEHVEEHAENSKRPRTETTEEHDFIHLSQDENERHGELTGSTTGTGETPFYGLLDEEELEYFRRADEVLELDQFDNDEERDIFLENVYRESDGKELKMAHTKVCSRLMERLILRSSPAQLKTLFRKFSGQFLHLVQHRFASHCCEALFIHSAPIVTQELTAPVEEEPKEGSNGDVFVTMENLFLYTISELESNLGYLLTQKYASHTLRVLLTVLAGLPLPRSSTRSLLESKRKEKITVAGLEKEQDFRLQSRSVPDSFLAALEKLIRESVAGMSTSDLRALSTHKTGNPTLQLLLRLELAHFGRQRAKDEDSLIRKLLPDDTITEGSESACFINGMVYDPVGSRLLESILEHAPGKMFKSLYKEFFKDRMASLARNEIAGYVVSKILERLSKEDLEEAVALIAPTIPSLIERNRTAVIKTVIERCVAREVDTAQVAEQLAAAYQGQNGFDIARLLKLGEPGVEVERGLDRNGVSLHSQSHKLHGSLLAQAMLTVPGDLSSLIFDSLIRLGTQLALSVARDPNASRTVQAALVSPHASIIFRRKMIQQFYGHAGEMALDPAASHVVDTIWEGTHGLAFIRERFAEELAENEAALRESLVGRAVWRNWKMDLYKRRRAEWVRQSRDKAGNDGFLGFPESSAESSKNERSDGKEERRGKSGIQLAREKHAAKKAKAHRTSRGTVGTVKL